MNKEAEERGIDLNRRKYMMSSVRNNNFDEPNKTFRPSKSEIAMLPNFYPKVSVITKQNAQHKEFKNYYTDQQNFNINLSDESNNDDDNEDDNDTNKNQCTVTKQWNRFSQDRIGFRLGKTTNRAANIEGKVKKRNVDDSQQEVERLAGNNVFGSSLPDLRRCTQLSEEGSIAILTTFDPNDIFMDEESKRVISCHDPSSSLFGKDTLSDYTHRVQVKGNGAFDQTRSRLGRRVANYRASFNEYPMMSQTVEPQLIVSRQNRSLSSQVNQINTNHTNIHHMNISKNNCESFSNMPTKTFISRKSVSITSCVSETIDTDVYSFVISEGDSLNSKYQNYFKFGSVTNNRSSVIPNVTRESILKESEKTLPLNALAQHITDVSYCTKIPHDETHKSLDTIGEYKLDAFRVRYNSAPLEERLYGPSLSTNSTRDWHLETYQSRTACLKENVCDNERDPTIVINSFDPSKFTTKGARPRLERRQNRTHTRVCYSESYGGKDRHVGEVLLSSSLGSSLRSIPTSGHNYERYCTKSVTKSKSYRLGADDIACRCTTTTPFLAEGYDCDSNTRFFPLNDSNESARLKKRKSHLCPLGEYKKSLIGKENSVLQDGKLYSIESEYKYSEINEPRPGWYSGTDQSEQKLRIHVSECHKNPLNSTRLLNNGNRKLEEDCSSLNLGMFLLFINNLHLINIKVVIIQFQLMHTGT